MPWRLQGRRRSVDRGTCRLGIELRNPCPTATWVTSGCRRVGEQRKPTSRASIWRDVLGPCAVRDPTYVRMQLVWEPGDPIFVSRRGAYRPHREAVRRTPMTNESGKSLQSESAHRDRVSPGSVHSAAAIGCCARQPESWHHGLAARENLSRLTEDEIATRYTSLHDLPDAARH